MGSTFESVRSPWHRTRWAGSDFNDLEWLSWVSGSFRTVEDLKEGPADDAVADSGTSRALQLMP